MADHSRKIVTKYIKRFLEAEREWQTTRVSLENFYGLKSIQPLARHIDRLLLLVEQKKLFRICGCYGSLFFDGLGFIKGWVGPEDTWIIPCPKEYADIRLLDVSEYLKYSQCHTVDILEIGFWDNKGNFTPPEYKFRQHVESVKRGEGGFL